MDNIDCILQLIALDALEKVAVLGAIVHSTIAIICKALHDGMLFFAEGDIFVLNICPTAFLLHLLLAWLQGKGKENTCGC